MPSSQRKVGVLGRLGVFPLVRLSLPGRRLLAYLAIRADPVTRGTASGELWPDLPDEVGRANLRRSLWQLPRGWVDAAADELILQAETDLARAHIAITHALKGERLTFDDVTVLSSDILPGWHEEWLLAAQDTFHLQRVQALEAACRTMSGCGEFALATQAGAAAIAAEPLRESAAEALIEAHLAQRNRFEAVRCFCSLEKRLRRELGLAPDPSLCRRVETIRGR
jgi:DNA-binding SARP family transcriptional activator